MMDCKAALPPRKRAKTVEEKEQRKMERILRNRRAAHASREKKRKYVEYLESYVEKLTDNLNNYQSNQNFLLSKLDPAQKSTIEMELKPIVDLKSFESEFNTNNKSNKHHLDDDEEQMVSPPVSEVSVKHEYKDSSLDPGSTGNNTDNDNLDELINGSYVSDSSSSSGSEFDSNLLLNPVDNYLSPVSINSPVNSPINLSLYDSNINDLEHNSEVVVQF